MRHKSVANDVNNKDAMRTTYDKAFKGIYRRTSAPEYDLSVAGAANRTAIGFMNTHN